jgi:hypothetical protein
MTDPWEDRRVAREHYRAAWALFRALETEDYAMAEEIARTWEPMDLQRGLTLVAASLRQSLQEHAREVGCDCGSDSWLKEHVFLAARGGNEGERR